MTNTAKFRLKRISYHTLKLVLILDKRHYYEILHYRYTLWFTDIKD